MNKLLLFFLFLIYLFASEETILFEKLFKTLFHKKQIYVLSSTEGLKYIENSKYIKITNNCKKADLILGDVDKNCSKPRFLLNYYKYKNDKDAIGAFYWRKGRPQLRLRKKNLKKYNLNLSKEFEDFWE